MGRGRKKKVIYEDSQEEDQIPVFVNTRQMRSSRQHQQNQTHNLSKQQIMHTNTRQIIKQHLHQEMSNRVQSQRRQTRQNNVKEEQKNITEKSHKKQQKCISEQKQEKYQSKTRKVQNAQDYTQLSSSNSEKSDETIYQQEIPERTTVGYNQHHKYEDFLTPKMESLLWSRMRSPENNDEEDVDEIEEEYLVKWKGRSHAHCQWLTRAEMQDREIELTPFTFRFLKMKITKTKEMKLKQGEYFNPNYLQSDRILTSTQNFTVIHHRKTNQIKGKWEESMTMILSKLLNMMKDGYPYGTVIGQKHSEQQGEISQHLGQILNKIYLGHYNDYGQIWTQLGDTLQMFLNMYTEKKSHYSRVIVAVMQSSMFLYEQWHMLIKQRYQMIKSNKQNKIFSMPDKQDNSANNSEQYMQINVEHFCRKNIFLTEKKVQISKNKKQIQLLNPGEFSFAWLNANISQQLLSYRFRQITYEDMQKLDLNVPVDKLYLVKWKDLSYQYSTWQTQSLIHNKSKIQQFKSINKIINKEIKAQIETNMKLHKALLEHSNSLSADYAQKQSQLYLLNNQKKRSLKQYSEQNVPIFKNYKILKKFQLESLNWLIKSWHQNRNTILADQMGLGKTIQTIAFIHHLFTYQNVTGPFLILAPLTTLSQWRRQFQEWTNFNCLLYYDQKASEVRNIIQQFQFFHLYVNKNGEILTTEIPKFNVLITNYQLFIQDLDILKCIPFQHMVLDEAHRLKNSKSQTTLKLKELPCSRITLLTGTPLQNKTKQLWTLLNFIEPNKFSSEEQFQRDYGDLSNEKQVKNFKKMLKPYLLRRVKEDVEQTIPKLSEIIIDVEMTKAQKRVYRGLLQKNKNSIIQGLTTANFNSISVQLRKCCNHPFLISAELEQQLKGENNDEQQQEQMFVKTSGKIMLLMKLLKKFKNEDKKCLIFSQFVMMIDMIKPFLEKQGYNCQVLKGNLSGVSRNQAINRFNQIENKTDVFLISTKAGGVGINLITATQIIIFDSDWNPQNDIQATARAHRIGQKKQVTVYRLITSNTYESEMFQISSKKLGLDKAVFTGECFKSTSKHFNEKQKLISKQQIQTLLKKGILGFLENTKNQDEYFNQSIQGILENNARKVQYSLPETSCSFSKSKFIGQEDQNGVQINAPDFWQVALKNVETPLDKLVKKADQLSEYSKQSDQQELMVEIYPIVYQFVRNKSFGNRFNGEDQKNLINLLSKICEQRQFNRKYRQISNNLIDEIENPSRRFKVKLTDITLKRTLPINQKQSTGQDKDSDSDILLRRRNKMNKEQQYENSEINSSEIDDGYQVINNIQKLCARCQRPKCTMFCRGICGRVYHKTCWQKMMLGNDTLTKVSNLQQLEMDLQTWQEQSIFTQKCVNCLSKDYFFPCSICHIRGTFINQHNKNKKKNNNYNNNNNIKQQTTVDQDKDDFIYKCGMKCEKFYHLKCLYEKKYHNKFADHAGKPININGLQQIDQNHDVSHFRCPSHYCFRCYNTDDYNSKCKILKCIRCPKAYHMKCLNSKKFLKISGDWYVCKSHLKRTHQSIQQLSIDINVLTLDKKIKKQFKKKQKNKFKNQDHDYTH